jgi:hypothetical protein
VEDKLFASLWSEEANVDEGGGNSRKAFLDG